MLLLVSRHQTYYGLNNGFQHSKVDTSAHCARHLAARPLAARAYQARMALLHPARQRVGGVGGGSCASGAGAAAACTVADSGPAALRRAMAAVDARTNALTAGISAHAAGIACSSSACSKGQEGLAQHA